MRTMGNALIKNGSTDREAAKENMGQVPLLCIVSVENDREDFQEKL